MAFASIFHICRRPFADSFLKLNSSTAATARTAAAAARVHFLRLTNLLTASILDIYRRTAKAKAAKAVLLRVSGSMTIPGIEAAAHSRGSAFVFNGLAFLYFRASGMVTASSAAMKPPYGPGLPKSPVIL